MAIDPKKKEETKKIMVKVAKPTSEVGDIELTKKYTDSKEIMSKNLEKKAYETVYDNKQGININKESMQAKPKVFVRKVIKSGDESGTTRIMSDDGKSVTYEGRSNMKATQDALKNNESQSSDTNIRRESNANFYNVNSGAKKDLDDKDKKTLIKLQKAVVKK